MSVRGPDYFAITRALPQDYFRRIRTSKAGTLLRIFFGESDRCHGKPLYEEIVKLTREEGMAGATVLRWPEGFGADSHLHTARILRLSEDLPTMIELVGTDTSL